MQDRTKVLTDLINYNQPISWIESSLKKFPWDSEEIHAVLNRKHIANVLQRYMEEKLFANQIEEWANIIECREDIELEQGHEDVLQECIHVLANPLLTQQLSKYNAQYLLNILLK